MLLETDGLFYYDISCCSRLFTLQGDYVFYVVGVWEHVHRTYCSNYVILAEDFKVTGL